jgi:hypothetical protein
MQFLKYIYYFFPVQLLVMHIKKNQFFLALWLLLFLTACNVFGRAYGIPYLLLDPEYLGKVDFFSFSILGAAFAGFMVTWNISTYTLNTHHFQFLAAFKRPFAVYSLNNAVIPIAFLITYFSITYHFQIKDDENKSKDVLLYFAGFLSGFFIVLTVAAAYFQATNRNIFNVLQALGNLKKIGKRITIKQNRLFDEQKYRSAEFPVEHFFTARLNIRLARSVEHYDDEMIRSVFRQNHYNAFVIQLMFFFIIIGLGFLIENEYFRLPSGASTLLLFSLLTSFWGFINFWLGEWKVPVLIVIVILVNVLVQQQIITYDNKAYGLTYKGEKAEYSYETLNDISSPYNVEHDKLNVISILNAWKKNTGEEKPKIVLLNFSGGGMSAAMFSTLILQKADSILNGKLLQNTFLMTGASGGMLGAAYFREIYLRRKMHQTFSYYHPRYADNIAKDLLNPIAFTILANDLFMPFRKFKLNGETYIKDRGYIFEKQFNENTEYLLDKTIDDYRQYEEVAVIPMMVLVPTIINDQRKLYIASQPVSFLMKPLNNNFKRDYNDVDGVDFAAMFKEQGAKNLKFTSALRMNGSYPYILPYVAMPSQPEIKVMDAGFRDNFGLETTVKFIHTFKDWIKDNTGGVVVVQVRSYKKEREIEKYSRETVIDRMVKPITNIYSNFLTTQEYHQNYLLSYANEWMGGKLEFVNFEYIPEKKEEEASLSLHLTQKEKQDIRKTIDKIHTQLSINRLKKALNNN